MGVVLTEGQSLLRLSLCYHHTAEMIDSLVDHLAIVRER
jgi:7-keto-8-aminopelargonate synthetase-like enzyme